MKLIGYVRETPNAVLMQAVHGWLTLAWLVAAPFVVIFFSESVPFLVFISVYAVVTGHWSSWQAARVETKQHEDADVQEVLDTVQEIKKLISGQ